MPVEGLQPETVHIDWEEQRVSFLCSSRRSASFCITDRRNTKRFEFICCIALAQKLACPGGQAAFWPGADWSFIEAALKYLEWPLAPGTIFTYWADWGSLEKCRGRGVRPESGCWPRDETAMHNIATALFPQPGKGSGRTLYLGPRTPEGNRFRYWRVSFGDQSKPPRLRKLEEGVNCYANSGKFPPKDSAKTDDSPSADMPRRASPQPVSSYLNSLRRRLDRLALPSATQVGERGALYQQRWLCSSVPFDDLDETDPRDSEQGHGRRGNPPYAYSQSRLFQAILSSASSRFCILGEAGSGKSTLLEEIAWTLAGNGTGTSTDAGGHVPFLLNMQAWEPSTDETLEMFVCRHVPALKQNTVAEILGSGRAVLLLDGLDEVADEGGRRRELLEWLDREVATQEIRRCTVVLAGRSWSFDWEQLRGFRGRALQLQPLKDRDVSKYVTDYFEDESTRGGELLRQWQASPPVRRLARQPFVLPLLCFLFEDREAVAPVSESHLLEEVMRKRLRQRALPEEPSLRLLGSLAWARCQSHSEDLCETEAFEVVAQARKRDRIVSAARIGERPQAVLQQLAQQSGLIVQAGTRYRFAEQSYLEYLAARHVAAQDTPEVKALVARRAWDPGWERPLEFMMAKLWEDRREVACMLVRWLLEESNAGHDDIWRTLILLAGRWMAPCGRPRTEDEKGLADEVALRVFGAWRFAVRNRPFRKHAAAHLSIARLWHVSPDEVMEALHEALCNEEIGEHAARALGVLGSDQAVDYLRSCIERGSSSIVQRASVEALGEIGSHSTTDALLSALDSECETVQAEAVRALGADGSPRAIGGLLCSLRDVSFGPRCEVAKVLGNVEAKHPRSEEIASELIAVVEDGDAAGEHLVMCAAEALGKLRAGKAVGPLRAALERASPYLRSPIAEALGEIGTAEAIHALAGATKHPAEQVRRAAIVGLCRAGPELAEAELIRALDDEEWSVRLQAAEALGSVGTDKAVRALIGALGDQESVVRCEGAHALGVSGARGAVGDLINAIGDRYDAVGTTAGFALARILGGKKAVAVLRDVMEDAALPVARNAPGVLAWLGVGPSVPLPLDDYYTPETVRNEVRQIVASDGVDALIHALSLPNAEVRAAAAMALGRLAAIRAVRHLIDALKDSEARVCRCAAESLGRIKARRAVGPLMDALAHSDGEVREHAAQALGEIGSDRAESRLLKVLEDGHDRACAAAAKALGKIGSAASEEPLRDLLCDQNRGWVVRYSAAIALRAVGSKSSAEAWVGALENGESDIRREAVVALGSIGGEGAIGSLVRALEDDDGSVREAAILALGRIGFADLADHVIRASDCEWARVRGVAAYALGLMGGQRAHDRLVELLGDHDVCDLRPDLTRVYVCDMAVEALKAMGSPRTLFALISDLTGEDSTSRWRAECWLSRIRPDGMVEALVRVLGDPEGRAGRLLDEVCDETGSTVFPSGHVERLRDLCLHVDLAPSQHT